MTILAFFNLFFFQWFFVRLTRVVPCTDRVNEYEWGFQYFIVPLTGWGLSFCPDFYVLGKGKDVIGHLTKTFLRNY